jgi:hypothetical protein
MALVSATRVHVPHYRAKGHLGAGVEVCVTLDIVDEYLLSRDEAERKEQGQEDRLSRA